MVARLYRLATALLRCCIPIPVRTLFWAKASKPLQIYNQSEYENLFDHVYPCYAASSCVLFQEFLKVCFIQRLMMEVYIDRIHAMYALGNAAFGSR